MLPSRLLCRPTAHSVVSVRALATSHAAKARRARRSGRDGGQDATTSGRRRRSPPPRLPPRPFNRGAVTGWLTLDGSEHPLKPSDVPAPTLNIMKTLRGAGHTAYLVGGAVRDALLGLPPKDYDVLTSAPADNVLSLFDRRAHRVGSRFPITLVRAGSGMTEVTSLDLFGGSSAGSAVTAADPVCPLTEAAALAASAAARDFTVNALFYDALSPAGLLHDPSGRGVADAAARVLRCCGAAGPAAVLADDPARVLRAARLAARCSLRVTPATVAAAMAAVPLVEQLPPARQQQEVSSALSSGAAARTLALWRAWGLLQALLPDLDAVADASGVPPPGAKVKQQPDGTRAPRLASLAAFSSVRALDALSSPSNPAPNGAWTFAVAAPVIETRLKTPAGLAAAIAAAAAREAASTNPHPLTPASITLAAIQTVLSDMITASPRSLSQAGRKRALVDVKKVLSNDRDGGRGSRRPSRRRLVQAADPTSDRQWDAVFDVALDWREWVRREWQGGREGDDGARKGKSGPGKKK